MKFKVVPKGTDHYVLKRVDYRDAYSSFWLSEYYDNPSLNIPNSPLPISGGLITIGDCFGYPELGYLVKKCPECKYKNWCKFEERYQKWAKKKGIDLSKVDIIKRSVDE